MWKNNFTWAMRIKNTNKKKTEIGFKMWNKICNPSDRHRAGGRNIYSYLKTRSSLEIAITYLSHIVLVLSVDEKRSANQTNTSRYQFVEKFSTQSKWVRSETIFLTSLSLIEKIELFLSNYVKAVEDFMVILLFGIMHVCGS